MITEVGSSNVDYFTYNKRLPVPGETIYGDSMAITGGGKGANQIAAAARLGAKTCFLSKLGDDKNAQIVIDDLKWAGVDIGKMVIEKDTFSGAGFITVGENAQNFITIIKGANALITPEYVEKNKDCILNAKIVMTEFMIPMETAEYATALARENGILNLVNPAPAFPIEDSFYKKIDIISPNEIEAKDLSGITVEDEQSAGEAAKFFHAKGVKTVVITMGSRGSFVSDGIKREFIKSYKVNATDTSGAGDSFNGGLAYALWTGKGIFEAAHFATAVAAISVTRKGTMPSMPTLEETLDMIKNGKSE